MSRFHSKYHKKNHHTNPTAGYPDSANDPIASPSDPFQGDFILAGSLSARGPVVSPYLIVGGVTITVDELLGLSALDIDLSDYTLTTDFLDLRNDHINTKTEFASASSVFSENIANSLSLSLSNIPQNPDITINGQNGINGNYTFSLNQSSPETINLSVDINTVTEAFEIPSYVLGLDNESPTKNTRRFPIAYVLSSVETEFASFSANASEKFNELGGTISSLSLNLSGNTANFGDGISNDLPALSIVDSVFVLNSNVTVDPTLYTVLRTDGLSADDLDTDQQDLSKRILQLTGDASPVLSSVDVYVRYFTIG